MAFFFGSLLTEEISQALWSGYSLTATVSFSQVVAFPAIFVLGLIITSLLRPFLLTDFALHKRTVAIVLLCCAASLVVLLLIPPYRSGLVFLSAMVFYSNWWHPIQSRPSFFLASLPWITATVAWTLLTQHRREKLHPKRLLFVCSVISFILLIASGFDNSVCLGEWDGGLRPNNSMRPGDYYGVALDLRSESQGSFRPFYQTY